MPFIVIRNEKVLKDGKLLYRYYRVRTHEDTTIVGNAIKV